MDIKGLDRNDEVKFHVIFPGAAFMIKTDLYIKLRIPCASEPQANAVNLRTGTPYIFSDDTFVEEVDAEVVVK